ncbi:hypothetical protein [Methanimicrococcus hongohii]|uniref:hypothetical protein n=1 Tax=Methanimicrococcus hongohii TaxID=3028295 RepID=UPI00292F90E0|nr:hypothetical protein [Methanimicrococcus sp. Hf6]
MLLANQVYVSACICSFLRNPLALNFARFAHKISGCCERELFVCSGRRCLFAAGGGVCFRLPVRFLFAACQSGLHSSRRCRQPQQLPPPREPPIFKKILKLSPVFIKIIIITNHKN